MQFYEIISIKLKLESKSLLFYLYWPENHEYMEKHVSQKCVLSNWKSDRLLISLSWLKCHMPIKIIYCIAIYPRVMKINTLQNPIWCVHTQTETDSENCWPAIWVCTWEPHSPHSLNKEGCLPQPLSASHFKDDYYSSRTNHSALWAEVLVNL